MNVATKPRLCHAWLIACAYVCANVLRASDNVSRLRLPPVDCISIFFAVQPLFNKWGGLVCVRVNDGENVNGDLSSEKKEAATKKRKL
jgi:hypothetical protein